VHYRLVFSARVKVFCDSSGARRELSQNTLTRALNAHLVPDCPASLKRFYAIPAPNTNALTD